MTDPSPLREAASRAVAAAMRSGADEAEVFFGHVRAVAVDLQKDDVHHASTAEEATFGVRIVKDGGVGFATVNREEQLDGACEEALAIARVAPPDPLNGLAEPLAIEMLDLGPDPAIAQLEIGDLVELAADLVARVKARDRRVVIDSGSVGAEVVVRGIETSRGVSACESFAQASGYLFGMAVDGKVVGSFDHDGHAVRSGASLRAQLEAAADRFVTKTLAAVGAGKGESFRGTVMLSPEVVNDFVIGNLAAVLSARAVRTGKSPLAGRVGARIAAAAFDLADDPRIPGGTASVSFDREGTPTQRRSLVSEGVLEGFLYDVYEARAAGVAPAGHARGGASAQPAIGVSGVVLKPGDATFEALCCEPDRCIVVSRFSGSSNAVTGDFSGVVKGGFLMKRGERRPIRETLITGNLYEALLNVTGVSREVRVINGRSRVPGLRIEGVSVTAG